MAFPKEQAIIPQSIADIEICLFYPDPTGTEIAGARYSIQVKYSDESIQVKTGNLLPYITQQEQTALLNFMATLRERAIAEIIG